MYIYMIYFDFIKKLHSSLLRVWLPFEVKWLIKKSVMGKPFFTISGTIVWYQCFKKCDQWGWKLCSSNVKNNSETVDQMCSLKKLFWKNVQNFQENIYNGVHYLWFSLNFAKSLELLFYRTLVDCCFWRPKILRTLSKI